MNRQIVEVVIYLSRYEKICYSVTNIVLLLFPFILFPNIYPGLNFIQVGAKSNIYIQILLSNRLFPFSHD